MNLSDVRTRLLIIAGSIALCVYLVYPLTRTINLGLDLKGGIHMVMRVKTDDAIKAELDLSAERIRASLAEKGMAPSHIETGGGALVFHGIDAAKTDEARSLLRAQ